MDRKQGVWLEKSVYFMDLGEIMKLVEHIGMVDYKNKEVDNMLCRLTQLQSMNVMPVGSRRILQLWQDPRWEAAPLHGQPPYE